MLSRRLDLQSASYSSGCCEKEAHMHVSGTTLCIVSSCSSSRVWLMLDRSLVRQRYVAKSATYGFRVALQHGSSEWWTAGWIRRKTAVHLCTSCHELGLDRSFHFASRVQPCPSHDQKLSLACPHVISLGSSLASLAILIIEYSLACPKATNPKVQP